MKIVICGAGGRDFHVFNMLYRDDAETDVVCFTAAQIPHIDSRTYEVAGPRYPSGIPIRPEAELEAIVEENDVDEVVFAYSDVHEDHLRALQKRVEPLGARFTPFDPDRTMLDPPRPCVAICAVRTGCGKSGVSRYVAKVLRECGLKVAAIRHPMPYGALTEERAVQRFVSEADLVAQNCTIEEREEYEPHLDAGNLVYAGIDFERIAAAAAEEVDVLVWDGGNNDTPFYRPNLLITLVDPLRPGDELTYFPGRWNLEHADIVVVAKSEMATEEALETVRGNITSVNPEAMVVDGSSPIDIGDANLAGKRVLVVEDGPTVTHGGMGYGAGLIAATRAGAEIVDARPYAVGGIAKAFENYPHLERVLPAIGYAPQDLADLEESIRHAECDAVIIGTPSNITNLLSIEQPTVRVRYRFEEREGIALADRVREVFC